MNEEPSKPKSRFWLTVGIGGLPAMFVIYILMVGPLYSMAVKRWIGTGALETAEVPLRYVQDLSNGRPEWFWDWHFHYVIWWTDLVESPPVRCELVEFDDEPVLPSDAVLIDQEPVDSGETDRLVPNPDGGATPVTGTNL